MMVMRMDWRPISVITLGAVAAACSPGTATYKQAVAPVLVGERRLVSGAWDEFKWSPDGTRLLLSRWEYQDSGDSQQRVHAPVAIADAESGEVQILPQTGYAPLWSPDGEFILLHSSGDAGGVALIWIYSLDSGQLTRLPGIENTQLSSWMEQGLFYQAGAGLERMRIRGLPANGNALDPPSFSKAELLLAFDGRGYGRWASPSPDGQRFLYIDEMSLAQRRWWLVQPDGRRVEMTPPLYSLGTCCAWSPDSKRLAYFGLMPGQGLYIADSSGRNLRRIVSTSQLGEGAFLALDFSPDGRWIAFTWAEAGEGFPFDRNQIYVVGVEGDGLQQLTADSSHPHNWLRWSPDGRYIAFKGSQRDIWLAEVQLP